MHKALYLIGIATVLGGCSVAGEDLYSDVVFDGDDPEAALSDDVTHGFDGASGSADDGTLGSPDGASEYETWQVDGHVSCDALGFYGEELVTIDDFEKGDYEMDEVVVWVTADNSSLSFTSTTGIRAAIVYGGPGAVVRAFSSDTFEHNGLHAPVGDFAPHPISGVSFCAMP